MLMTCYIYLHELVETFYKHIYCTFIGLSNKKEDKIRSHANLFALQFVTISLLIFCFIVLKLRCLLMIAVACVTARLNACSLA